MFGPGGAGVRPDGAIAHLVVTHPHNDHYNAVSGLVAECAIGKVTLSPFWFYAGTPAYHTIINRAQSDHIPLHFLSGYERHYPDGGTFPDYPEGFYLELVGPPNYMFENLRQEERNLLNPNHLSILARLNYGRFRMVFAADAQMENWAHYDREGLLEKPCDVLKAAHHGSKRGTQWERLERLEPKLAIVPRASGPLNSASSPTATLAENIRLRMPSPSASHSMVSPRTNGILLIGPRYSAALTGSSWSTMFPSGARIATANNRLPRIITPSITTCPP